MKGLWTDWKSLLLFLSTYVAFALVTIGLLVILPAAGLAVYLAISIWHFSGDWKGELLLPTRILGAAGIIFVPMISGWDTFDFVGYQRPRDDIGLLIQQITGLGELASPLVGKIVLFAAAGFAFFEVARGRSAAFEIIGILMAAYCLRPLPFFILYFCYLHSPRHFTEAAGELGITSPKRLLFLALPVSAATIALGIAAYLFLPSVPLATSETQLVFMGLAALSVPHMLLVDLPFKKTLAQPASEVL